MFQEREAQKLKELERKQEEEEKLLKKEEERKHQLMLIMSINAGLVLAHMLRIWKFCFRGHQAKQRAQRRGRGANAEKKKKVLSERRKLLNVDHLCGEKLQEKAIQLHDW